MARAFHVLVPILAAVSPVLAQETQPVKPPQGETACTMEYAPVCAKRGAEEKTFGNRCTAEAAGYEIVASGECGGAGQDRK